MTKEEIMERMENGVKEYNIELIHNGGRFEKLESIKERLRVCAKDYAKQATLEVYSELRKLGDGQKIMEAAIRMLQFPVKVAKVVKEDESVSMQIVDTYKYIDLEALHNHCNKSIGFEHGWATKTKKLNVLLTYEVGIAVNADIKKINDSIFVSDVVKAIDLGKTPCSKTNLLKTFNEIVRSMVGDEYKITSHNVNFMRYLYARRDKRDIKALKVMRDRDFIQLIANEIHLNMMGERHEVVGFKVMS